jgi:hypothetical protein
MSRVTAAFVCALCDPDNPRPASIMCSNNCGRYVCAVHAVPRKGPGSAMICQSCAEALGVIDRPKPRPAPVPEVRPLIEVPPDPDPTPLPLETKAESAKPIVEAAAAAAIVSEVVKDEAPAAEQVTIVTPAVMPPPTKEAVVIDSAASVEPRSAAHLSDTEPAPVPKSAASETIVSQRGNTLQVPKVSPTLGKPPQPIAPKPRKAQRSGDGGSSNLDWTMIAMVAGTVGLGIVGFVMILAALAG